MSILCKKCGRETVDFAKAGFGFGTPKPEGTTDDSKRCCIYGGGGVVVLCRACRHSPENALKLTAPMVRDEEEA